MVSVWSFLDMKPVWWLYPCLFSSENCDETVLMKLRDYWVRIKIFCFPFTLIMRLVLPLEKKFSTTFFLYFWLLNRYKCWYHLIKRPGSDKMTWWFGEQYRGWSDKDIMSYYKRLFADRFLLLLWILFWIVIIVQFVMVFFIFNW